MGALRWILLLAGLVFLALLAGWELRRARRGGGSEDPARSARSEPALGSLSEDAAVSAPRLADSVARSSVRVRALTPPRVDLPPLEADEDEAVSLDPGAEVFELDDELEGVTPRASAPAPLSSTTTPEEIGTPVVVDIAPRPETVPVAGAPLVVEWPEEAQRHVISLRVVSAGEERCSGRALRQALAAAGFVHGRYDIFHRPTADGHVLLSAANLSNPGTFDPATMDFQRFTGVSLFAVLPGPMLPMETLTQLLGTARELAQRLPARLQDEHGAPLDAARVEDLRRALQQLPERTVGAEPAA